MPLNGFFTCVIVPPWLTFLLQEVWDARKIRNRILSNFELALQPGVDESEACRLLHTVIVGGGPTGVEFGAELFDFVQQVRVQLGHIVNTSLYNG